MKTPIKWSKKKTTSEEERKRIIEKGSKPKVAEDKQKEREAIFRGLEEKEINALYSMADVRRLKEGDILFREGEVDQRVFVVLDGTIKITRTNLGYTEDVGKLKKGAWIGDVAFSRTPRSTTASADGGAASVMALDKETIHSLEKNTQLYFYKHLNSLSNLRLTQLELHESALNSKISAMTENLFAVRTARRADYAQSELIQNIINRIPRLPAFVGTLSIKLTKEDTSAAEVADLISEDASLTAAVLKVINSPYYGFQQKITDINSAVTLLGFQALYQMVVEEGVRKAMPDTPEFKSIHQNSVALSHIAFAASMAFKRGVPVRMATIGLLHNIGQAVISLIKTKNPVVAVFIDSIDQTQMGALLLKKWNMPDLIWQTVECLNFPDFAPPDKIHPDILDNVAVLYMARLCHDLLQGKSEIYLPLLFFEDYKRYLNLGKVSPEDIMVSKIIPALRKREARLPIFLRNVLREFK